MLPNAHVLDLQQIICPNHILHFRSRIDKVTQKIKKMTQKITPKPSKIKLKSRPKTDWKSGRQKTTKILKNAKNCLQNDLPRVNLFMPFWLLAPLWPAMGSNMAPRRPPGDPKNPKSTDFDPQMFQNGAHLAPKMIKNGAQMALDT